MGLQTPKLREIPWEMFLNVSEKRNTLLKEQLELLHEVFERTKLPLMLTKDFLHTIVDFSSTGVDPNLTTAPQMGKYGFEIRLATSPSERFIPKVDLPLLRQGNVSVILTDKQKKLETFMISAVYKLPLDESYGPTQMARVILDALNEKIDYVMSTPDINMRRLKPSEFFIPQEIFPHHTFDTFTSIPDELRPYQNFNPVQNSVPLTAQEVEEQTSHTETSYAQQVQPTQITKGKIRQVTDQDVLPITRMPFLAQFLVPIMERTNAKLAVDTSMYDPAAPILRGIVGRNNNPRDLQVVLLGFRSEKYSHVMFSRHNLTEDQGLGLDTSKFFAIVIDSFLEMKKYSVRVDMSNPTEAQNLIIDFIDRLPIYR